MIKEMIKNILANRNYQTKNQHLISQGAHIGDGSRLNCKVSAFGTEPYLVTVGKNCLFADGVKFITHDGGVSVLNNLKMFGDTRMDIIAPIIIGDNVYIGTGAYIMPGVEIGDNCIVGANAIVTHNIPANSVAVGIPAKVIKTIDEYYSSTMEKNWFYPTARMSFDDKKKYFETIFCLNNTKNE